MVLVCVIVVSIAAFLYYNFTQGGGPLVSIGNITIMNCSNCNCRSNSDYTPTCTETADDKTEAKTDDKTEAKTDNKTEAKTAAAVEVKQHTAQV